MSAQSFAAKFKSKKEIYNFLTIDGKVYLPPYETVSVYHMRDIVSGAKKVSDQKSSLETGSISNFIFLHSF